jgi:hypothetical protein
MRTLTIIAALLCVLPVAAKTLSVGPDAEYADIQTALDAASAGDVVSVAAGFYKVPGGVKAKTSDVTLKGAGADKTILDGMGKPCTVVSVEAKGVTVTGLTLQNGGDGFYAGDNNYVTLSYCVVTGFGNRGILLGSGEPYALIDHNTFAHNQGATMYSFRDDARTKFTNNISYENERAILTDSTMSHMTIKYNCFYDGTNDSEATRTSKTNFRADPLFVDATEDFHLMEGSPCLGKGTDGSNIGALDTGKNPVIEKPVASKPSGGYEIVVCTQDSDLGEKILQVLRTEGFASSESYVDAAQNDEASITYEAATKDDIKAMLKLVGRFYDGKLEELYELNMDNTIFINLP